MSVIYYSACATQSTEVHEAVWEICTTALGGVGPFPPLCYKDEQMLSIASLFYDLDL